MLTWDTTFSDEEVTDFFHKQIVFLLLYGTLEALVTPSSAVG